MDQQRRIDRPRRQIRRDRRMQARQVAACSHARRRSHRRGDRAAASRAPRGTATHRPSWRAAVRRSRWGSRWRPAPRAQRVGGAASARPGPLARACCYAAATQCAGGNSWPRSPSPSKRRHIMMFARAIGDTNPVYHDAEAGEEVRGRRHHRAAHLPAGGGAIRPGLSAALASRPALVRLRQDADRRGEPALGRRRPACRATLSNTTGRCGRRRADGGDASPARPGNARASAPAS